MSFETGKVRKWTRRSKPYNPTMNSINMLSNLNPEVPRAFSNSRDYYSDVKSYENPQRQWTKRQAPQSSLEDSLEVEYERLKNSRKEESGLSLPSEQPRKQKVWASQQGKFATIDSSNPASGLGSVNFRDSKAIRNKQLHGYNIISNI